MEITYSDCRLILLAWSCGASERARDGARRGGVVEDAGHGVADCHPPTWALAGLRRVYVRRRARSVTNWQQRTPPSVRTVRN
jgi:hypothetical protein